MRILIIGEYSGFAKNLKRGFKCLGHDTIVFSWGDGSKKISSDFPEDFNIKVANITIGSFQIKGTWIIRNIIESFTFNKKVRSISRNELFDVVFLLNHDFIRFKRQFWKPYFTIDTIKKIVKNSNGIYLSLCGNDFVFNSYLSNIRKANPSDVLQRQRPTKREIEVFETFKSEILQVIPVMYEYAEPYRNSKLAKDFTVMPTIPLPLWIDGIDFCNTINGKIVIFHGLNRDSKGTSIIAEALSEIKKIYSDRVEVVIDGHLPLNDYLNILKNANIVIDQCYGFSYGMNAIYSMAMGKVVLSGNEPECKAEFNRPDLPIVNIEPNTNQIVQELSRLIENPKLIEEISIKSRKFVEEFHESKIVAKQYLDIFTHN